MKAREEILGRIQSAKVAPNDHPIRRDYAHVVKLADPVGMFVERVEDYQATVIRTGPDAVAAAVLQSLDGAARVVVPAGFNAAWLPDGIDIVMDEPALSSSDLDGVDAVVTSAVAMGPKVRDHSAKRPAPVQPIMCWIGFISRCGFSTSLRRSRAGPTGRRAIARQALALPRPSSGSVGVSGMVRLGARPISYQATIDLTPM